MKLPWRGSFSAFPLNWELGDISPFEAADGRISGVAGDPDGAAFQAGDAAGLLFHGPLPVAAETDPEALPGGIFQDIGQPQGPGKAGPGDRHQEFIASDDFPGTAKGQVVPRPGADLQEGVVKFLGRAEGLEDGLVV